MVAGKKNKTENTKKITLASRGLSVKPTNSKKVIDKSLPEVSVNSFAPSHLKPLPHQIDAFNWTVENLKKSLPTYLALDAGLGKTIVAAMVSNFFKGFTVFYVCPPFLTTNTDEEFKKWCFEKKLILLPDSMIAKQAFLKAFSETVRECSDRCILIVDEAHRFKNEGTFKKPVRRTRALFKNILPHFKGKVVFMSGTPLPNSRPKELWPVLKNAVPKIFGVSFFNFGLKYCGGYKDAFGWNFDGFTNRKEFTARVRKSFMLRMKKDVLNLPPKTEGLLTVGEGIPPVISNLEKKILAHYSPEDLIEGKITEKAGVSSLHLSTYLKLLGEYKLKYVLPFIESLLDETKENILIFGVHKAAIANLQTALKKYDPIVVTGDVPKKKRHELVKEFQTNKDRRIFIGNIQACGVGFTLTKATRVLFVEFSWVDGDNSQASDRAHRIGQNSSVLVQYVVLKDSFDRTRMETLLRKRALSI